MRAARAVCAKSKNIYFTISDNEIFKSLILYVGIKWNHSKEISVYRTISL